MTETRASYSSVYSGDNTIRHAIRQGLAAFNERYPDEAETVRANEDDLGNYEVTIRGSSNY